MTKAYLQILLKCDVGYVVAVEEVGAADGGDVSVDGIAGLCDGGGAGDAHHYAAAGGHQVPVLGLGSHMEDAALDVLATFNVKAFLV